MKQLNRHILKLLMLFVGLFALSNVGWANYTAGQKVYFQIKKDGWKDSGAKFRFEFSSGSTWTKKRVATYVSGTVDIYECVVPTYNGISTWTDFHVYRMDPNNDGEDAPSWNACSNIKSSNYSNLYKVTDWNAGEWVQYYIQGPNNKWDSSYRFSNFNPSDNTISVTISSFTNGDDGFKINGSNDGWWSTNNSIKQSNYYYNLGNNQNDFLPYEDKGSVTFTIILKNGEPSQIKAVWPETKSVYFYSNQGLDFDEEITKEWGKPYEITLDADNKGSYGPIYVDDDHYLVFSSTNASPITWGANVFRPSGTVNLDVNGNEKLYSNQQTTAYSGNNNEKSFKMPGGTFMLQVDDYSNGQIKFKLIPYHLIDNNKDLAGRYFLVGTQLNNNVPSPAWELVKDGSSYKLDSFAMRYSNDIGVVYFNANGDPTYIDCNVNNMPTKEVGGEWKSGYYSSVGWSYSASFTPNNATNPTSGTLTLNNGSLFNVNNNMLPYIGVLGYNFIQKNQVKTPMKDKTTSSGWEQAYIEYDEDGYPILKNDGSAYYNTVWPPKHNILMQANIGNDKLNVSSKDLTLIPVGTQSGTQWASDLTGEEYANLRTELNGKSTEYTRYIVRNVWMQGEFKLWTGWAGIPASWGANWDTHFYWGPKQSDGIEFFDSGTNPNGVKQVNYNTVYSTSNLNYSGSGHDNANLNFGTLRKNNAYSRAYYKTMELFIPKDNRSGDVYDFLGSKLYLTQAPGGAQIDAIGRQSDEVREAYYAPSLTYVPTGYHVSSYRVTRYAFEAAADSEHFDTELDPCDKERKKVSYANALVVGESKDLGKSINTKEAFADRFRNDADGYTLDAGNYEAGRYIFRLEVTFTKDDDATKTMTADEWSPYIEFIGDFKIGLDAYQLVELPKTDNPFSDYTHITYDRDNNYKLVSYDGTTISKYDDVPANTTESVITDIYNNKGKWTNKVLLASQVPAQYYNTGRKRQIEGFYINGTNNDANALKRVGTDYLKVVDQTTNLNNQEYSAQFDAKFVIDDSGEYKTLQEAINKQDVTASATYSPFLPSPRVKEAYVEVYFGANSNKTTDNDTEDFWFEGVNGQPVKLESARYQNVKEIVEVDLPNVTDELKSKMGDIFTYRFDKYSENQATTQETIELDENGKLPTSAVIPSTLFSSTNNDATGNDIWDYKMLNYSCSYNNIYDRGWNSLDEGKVSSIKIETMKPLSNEQKNSKSVIKVSNSMVESIIVNGEDHLVGSFDLYIEMNAESEAYVSRETKDNSDKLLHGKTNDYYYFTVYNKNKSQQESDYILASSFTTNGEKFEKTGTLSGAEFVVTVDDINSGNGGGHSVKICIDYGKMSEIGYSWDKIKPYYDKFINDRKNFQIRVSYLYPFFVPSTTININGKSRMAAQLTGSVIKSEATKWDLDSPDDVIDMEDGVVTGLEGIGYDNAGSIRAGQGFIEVEGQSVAIYNASGICIATAEGRYDVAPGVYVVRLNGATSKVLVK